MNNNVSNQDRDRLKRVIGKKFDTTMIFPLSQFEAAFGAAWGNGKSEENLTDEERVNRKKWQECRNNILNLGNHQKRNANVELDTYDVERKRYQAVFIPKEQYDEMEDNEKFDRFNR